MINLSWVGLSDLAQPRLTKGGQPYLITARYSKLYTLVVTR